MIPLVEVELESEPDGRVEGERPGSEIEADLYAARGQDEEARTLYEDMTPAPAAVDGDGAASGPPPGEREAGSGRPTKRERRAIDRMRDDI